MACEFSGRVRDAFIRHGYDAISCDWLDSETEGPHYKGDVRDILGNGWDLMIAFPPCTSLAISGARWFQWKSNSQSEAIEFVKSLYFAPIYRVAVENPIGVLSTRWRHPDQIIQPWHFGDEENKKTCLWLKNLPALVPNKTTGDPCNHVHHETPSRNRWKNRSRTRRGIANEMAIYWGSFTKARLTHVNRLHKSGLHLPAATGLSRE